MVGALNIAGDQAQVSGMPIGRRGDRGGPRVLVPIPPPYVPDKLRPGADHGVSWSYRSLTNLEGDPEGRTFAEILVDVVATEVIEPWGGGKWHLEIFRSANPEPEDWNGEM